MIYNVKWTGTFKKSYKLAKKRGLDITLLSELVSKLSKDIPLEQKYKDHELVGNYKGVRECVATFGCLPSFILKLA